MNKTRLSLALHQIFNPQGHQFATGVIIEGDPPRRLIPPLNAWVTLTALKPPPRRGRKQNLARKAAVGLAHAWHCDRLNLSKSAADRALASHFGYSDERAARRARIDGEKVLQSGYFYFSLIPFHADTNQGCVILLEKETSFAVTPEHLQFKGRGWVWNSREQEARYGRIEGEATSDPPMDDQQINQLRQYISGWGQELGE